MGLRRGWRWIAGGLVAGLLLAMLVLPETARRDKVAFDYAGESDPGWERRLEPTMSSAIRPTPTQMATSATLNVGQ